MKNNKSQNFIFTMDKEAYDYLIKNNFTPLSENNGNYIFMNNGKFTFDNDEDKKTYENIITKIAYTNVLCI